MKDGSVILDVTIIADTAESVTARMKDKSVKQIYRSNIIRVLYTELKLGKIYVQKRDGEGVVAYLVDEDRSSYTFRKDLYKAEEFTINRGDVLFMAEKNPSGLKVDGEVKTDRVSLRWLPPYDAVKRYNLYIKKNKKDKYTLAETSSTTSVTVSGLSSNTTYFLIVTGVDREDNESEPSNELKITTKNIPPERPSGLRVANKDASGKITLNWNETRDIDGTVKGYIIYNHGDDGLIEIGRSAKPEYTIPSNISVYDVEVSAFDELDSESEKSGSYRSPAVIISVLPMMFFPGGKLGMMYESGYGFMMNIGLKNIPMQRIEFGINSGYVELDGEKDLEVVSMKFLPLTVYGGYHFYPVQWLSIFPYLRTGFSYSAAEYTGYTGRVSKNVVNPVTAAGASVNTGFDSFYFTGGFDCGLLFEKSESKPFFQAFAGFSLLIYL